MQDRNHRAYRYAAANGLDEFVAELMLGALDEIADSAGRCAALAHFVGSVGADNARLLQQALEELPTGTKLRYSGLLQRSRAEGQ